MFKLPFLERLPKPGLVFALVPELFSLGSSSKGREFLHFALYWKYAYLDSQAGLKNRDKYCVETKLDHEIPFRPEEVGDYILIMPQLISLAKKFSLACDREEVDNIVSCFREVTDVAANIFDFYPTFMPRYTEHQNSDLKFIQAWDHPVNCCPSLHIAYSTLAYNIGKHIISPEEFQPLEETIAAMTASVLYTKQHALVDVVYGKILPAAAFAKYFPEKGYDFFPDRKSELPSFAATWIEQKVNAELAKLEAGKSLLELVGEELDSGRYEVVTSER